MHNYKLFAEEKEALLEQNNGGKKIQARILFLQNWQRN